MTEQEALTARSPWSLEGRTAVVTGASRGIGEATARALDDAGARVVLVARSGDRLTAVARELKQPAVVIEADLADRRTPELVAEVVAREVGTLDILVNNAAAAVRVPTLEMTEDSLDQILTVNVRNLLMLTAKLIPLMLPTGGGSIINLSSLSGLLGTPSRAAYCASKSAIDGITRSLAQEFGHARIRVNAVAPGIADTKLWASNKAIPGVEEAMNKHIPLGRWGRPEEIASVIAFLASDAAAYVTAQVISVDGGMADTLDLYTGAI